MAYSHRAPFLNQIKDTIQLIEELTGEFMGHWSSIFSQYSEQAYGYMNGIRIL